jgi:hypothetical protein
MIFQSQTEPTSQHNTEDCQHTSRKFNGVLLHLIAWINPANSMRTKDVIQKINNTLNANSMASIMNAMSVKVDLFGALMEAK